MIRIVTADDQALVRGGLQMILQAQPDITVVGEAADGIQAVHTATRLKPDLVLMDIRMPRLNGIEATRQLMISTPGTTRVLILTTFGLDNYVYEALRAGASGFLLKDSPPSELVHAVRLVATGEALLSPPITQKLIDAYVQRRPPPDGLPESLRELSGRELDVFKLLASGKSNAEIAGTLFLSEGTVKTHMTRIQQKLNLRDRVQAVVLAYESGLIQPRTEPNH